MGINLNSGDGHGSCDPGMSWQRWLSRTAGEPQDGNHGYTPKLRALAQRDSCSNKTTNDEYETFCFPPVLSIFMNLWV